MKKIKRIMKTDLELLLVVDYGAMGQGQGYCYLLVVEFRTILTCSFCQVALYIRGAYIICH